MSMVMYVNPLWLPAFNADGLTNIMQLTLVYGASMSTLNGTAPVPELMICFTVRYSHVI